MVVGYSKTIARYRKLLVAWKNARPPPATAEAASALLLQTLQGHHTVHVQGLLRFYGLPAHVAFVAGGTWPQGVQYEIHTLPVEDRAVGDGDTITVYVDVHRDAREAAAVPAAVMDAVNLRQAARGQRNYPYADALQKQIQQAGYKVFDAKDGSTQCIAKKYRVRLKGVDAPESSQPYGQQSKATLNNLVQGHALLIHVYTQDQYGRLVGDVHCNGTFIQEALLKKGCVWHYTQYDKRPTFAKWEAEAKAARVGLWAVANPERPWEYRKDRKNSRDIDV
jgi:endonuclease YncB( thermonuclease family)